MSEHPVEQATAAGRRDAIVGDGAVEVVISFAPILMSAADAKALRTGSVLEIGARQRRSFPCRSPGGISRPGILSCSSRILPV